MDIEDSRFLIFDKLAAWSLNTLTWYYSPFSSVGLISKAMVHRIASLLVVISFIENLWPIPVW